MFENWAFDSSTLRQFAVNAAGSPMPLPLIEALRVSSRFGRASSSRQQMFYAQVSLQLHMRDPTVAGFDPASIVRELCLKYSPYPPVPNTHFEANFGHLMGYSAIYYTYMWSQVLDPTPPLPFFSPVATCTTGNPPKPHPSLRLVIGHRSAAFRRVRTHEPVQCRHVRAVPGQRAPPGREGTSDGAGLLLPQRASLPRRAAQVAYRPGLMRSITWQSLGNRRLMGSIEKHQV